MGNGGTTISGGTTGTGGSTAKGGTSGTGGTINAGGTTGNGGITTPGGTTGSGGATGKGGTSGTGGSSAGNGGSAGISTGGTTTTGGSSASNGGNTGVATGGTKATGGSSSGSGGNTGVATGGTKATGGSSSGSGGATTGGTTGACTAGPPLTGGTKYCASTTGTLSDGVGYSVWLSDSTTGTNCGTFYNIGAAFKSQWNMASGGDLLTRAGLSWNSDKTYDQLGTVSADYAYTKAAISNANVYVGIYGWSVSPLVEFYIVEEWIGWNPGSNATKKSTWTVDGGTYDIYTHTQTNQPSIQGTATFQQFFSVRQSARQCGHISISEHFKAWANQGMTLGKMFEAKILVEAMGGSGTIDFTNATVVAR